MISLIVFEEDDIDREILKRKYERKFVNEIIICSEKKNKFKAWNEGLFLAREEFVLFIENGDMIKTGEEEFLTESFVDMYILEYQNQIEDQIIKMNYHNSKCFFDFRELTYIKNKLYNREFLDRNKISFDYYTNGLTECIFNIKCLKKSKDISFLGQFDVTQIIKNRSVSGEWYDYTLEMKCLKEILCLREKYYSDVWNLNEVYKYSIQRIVLYIRNLYLLNKDKAEFVLYQLFEIVSDVKYTEIAKKTDTYRFLCEIIVTIVEKLIINLTDSELNSILTEKYGFLVKIAMARISNHLTFFQQKELLCEGIEDKYNTNRFGSIFMELFYEVK